MKRISTAMAVLALAATSAFADVSKEDIKKLAAAGVGDDVIVAFIKANSPAPKLSADEIVDLKKAGVSDKVIEAMVSATGPSTRALDSAPVPAPQRTETPSFPAPGTRPVYYVEQPQTVYVPSTTYYYYSSPSVVYYSSRPYYSYRSCGGYSYSYPTYYSYPSYNYYSYPSWSFGFGYSRSSCRRGSGWGVSVRW